MATQRTEKLRQEAKALRDAVKTSEKQHEAFMREIQRPLATLREVAEGSSQRSRRYGS
jgi:Xaa-Pro aminopeptidase